MADQDPFSGLRTGPWVGANNDSLFKGLADENTVVPGGVIEDQSITNAKITNLNAEKIDAGTLSVTGSMKIQTTGTSPQLEVTSTGTVMRDNAGLTILEINGATTTLNADIINAGTINGSLVDVTNINATNITTGTISAINVLASTITNDPAGVGLLIQGDGTGVDAGFGGVNDAVIYAGYNATTVDNAIANAPNSIYLSPTSVTLPDTTTGAGISIVGGEGVSVTSPQVLVGTTDVPLTGDTAYFGPSYFGAMPDGVIIYSELNDVTLMAAGVVKLDANTEVSGDLNVQGDITIQGAGIIPPGVVEAYLGAYNNIPNGWLLCDNSYVSRTTYAALFAVIGTSYGTTTASNFRLPNLFGHMLVGGSATTVPGSGQQAGSTDSYLNSTWDHNHVHSHVTDPAATTSGTNSASFGAATGINAVASNGHTHSTNIAATTSDTDSTTMSVAPTQKRTRVNYIIKT